MTLAVTLAEFTASANQCDSLIANAHSAPGGAPLLSLIDRQQITVAAFLNLYIAWESFLEASLVKLMTGQATILGGVPTRFVNPPTEDHARRLVIGVMKFFDYANHDNMRKIAVLYFDQGYPFEPHLGSIISDLQDMRTMRNASAHITATTQIGLEGLATRIFGAPSPGISLYGLLTAIDPRHPPNTVFVTYRDVLLAASTLIANG